MKRLLTLVLVAGGAALLTGRRQLEQARSEYDEAIADLLAAQDAQCALIEEREHWRGIAQQQQATIAHLIEQPAHPAPELPADGGVWVMREGWHAPRGPFVESSDAADEAEHQSHLCGDAEVFLLGRIGSVRMSAEAAWDYADH